MSDLQQTVFRGRVTKDQALCLQKCRTFLVAELECQVMVNSLFSKNILDLADKQHVLSGTTQRQQNETLLDIVAMRTPTGFKSFLDALQKTGHEAAYQTVRTTLNGIEASQGDLPTDAAGTDKTVAGAAVSYDDMSEDAVDMDLANDKILRDILGQIPSRLPTPGGETSGELDSLRGSLDEMDECLHSMQRELSQQSLPDEPRTEDDGQQKALQTASKVIRNLEYQLQAANEKIRQVSTDNAEKSKQLEEAKQKNTELLGKVRGLQDQIQMMNKQMQRMENENQDLKQKIGDMGQQMDTKIDAMKQELRDVQQQIRLGNAGILNVRQSSLHVRPSSFHVRPTARPGYKPF